MEQQGGESKNFSFAQVGICILSSFTYRCSWFLDPWAPNKDLNHCLPFRNYTGTTPPASLALTFADNKLWDFLPPIIL